MIRVCTGSRLHFGFLHVDGAKAAHEPQCGGALPAPDRRYPGAMPAHYRHYGGVGMMVAEPAVQVHFESTGMWSAEGPLAERALDYVQQVATQVDDVTPGRVVVEACPPEHMGLGVGTQLGLAVARLVTSHRPELDAVTLARLVGRGRRSAIGIHGFERGGFLVEGGKGEAEAIAPLVCRLDFPADWRVLLILPSWGRGLAGSAETEAMRCVQGQSHAETDAMCRLVLMGILPALVERDVDAFGEALYEFNRRAGEVFRDVQGGIYSHPRSADVAAWIRREGVKGVGQSSWGPGLFAMIDDPERGAALRRKVAEAFGLAAAEVILTTAHAP